MSGVVIGAWRRGVERRDCFVERALTERKESTDVTGVRGDKLVYKCGTLKYPGMIWKWTTGNKMLCQKVEQVPRLKSIIH